MDKYKDPWGELIREDLIMEAKAIEKEVAESDIEDMSDELMEEMRIKLYEKIAEREKERVYAKLSEEDQEALRLGRQMLKAREAEIKEENQEENQKEKIVYRRKRKRIYVAVALVALLVLAMGATCIGGAERIVEMMSKFVGNREVVQVDTDENLVIENEKEEEAYQKLKDVFGVDVVKIVHLPEGMKFVDAIIDPELQTAILLYESEDNSIRYYISSHNTDSSWGRDVEDVQTDYYYIDHDKQKIEVTEYATPVTETKYYAAHFTYSGLEYYLIGTIERDKFDFLVKNLIFF